MCHKKKNDMGPTYHINPGPRRRVTPSIGAFVPDDQDQQDDRDHGAPKDARHRFAHALIPRDLEAPNLWVELGVHDRAEDDRMDGKSQVVESHGRFWRDRIAHRVLLPD